MAISLHGTGTDNLAGLIRPRKTNTPVLVNGDMTISQSTDVPTGYGFAKSFKVDCTTADASPASGDLMTFPGSEKFGMTEASTKRVGMGLITFYILSIGTILAVLYAELGKLFKK